MNRSVVVFTDDPGWHGKRLKEAFNVRGFQSVFCSLKDCHFHLSSQKPCVFIPGFQDQLPPIAFVRGVPGGSLQQVISRLDILHALKMLGVKVYNDAISIEHTVDKAMTSFLMHFNNIPTPETWVLESRNQAHSIIRENLLNEEHLVIKPLFGSQGEGVRLLSKGLPFPLPGDEFVDGLYYFQKYIDSGENNWHDHRVFVINGKAIGAMVRRGNSWINNVAKGGRCEVVADYAEIAEISEAASKALNIDYCGVDVIRSVEGKLYVLEVNSIPAWKGIQSVLEIDIAQALVDDVLSKSNI